MIKIKSIKSLNTNNNYTVSLPGKSEFKYMNIDESMNYMDSYIRESSHDIHLFLNESYTDSMILNESVFDKVKEFFKKIKDFIKKAIEKIVNFFMEKVIPFITEKIKQLKFKLKIGSIYVSCRQTDLDFIKAVNKGSFIKDDNPAVKIFKEIERRKGKERYEYLSTIELDEDFEKELNNFNKKCGIWEYNRKFKDMISFETTNPYKNIKVPIKTLIQFADNIPKIKKEQHDFLQEVLKTLDKIIDEIQNYAEEDEAEKEPHDENKDPEWAWHSDIYEKGLENINYKKIHKLNKIISHILNQFKSELKHSIRIFKNIDNDDENTNTDYDEELDKEHKIDYTNLRASGNSTHYKKYKEMTKDLRRMLGYYDED